MKKIVYHGSDQIIMRPQYGVGSLRNDYGRGFYCTESLELANEWACKKGSDGFANVYELDLTNLQICNLNSGEYTILHWLALLTRYRGYWQRHTIAEEAKDYLQKEFLIDLEPFDLVIGYRADDSYFSFAQDFIAGTISLQKLSNAMRLGKLGEQVMLRSPAAFGQITFLTAEPAFAEEYYVKKVSRDLKARRDYAGEKKCQSQTDQIYMLDILRGNFDVRDLRV